ncbi:MAG: 3-methyl-2-oxobutanoate dehydrogenase subunit VorB [Desulfurispora sp.]|uniref:3-methyl-2-oxobutanoate dehydrogenase subunit VorB n=1 Tax=Desulfurispora sp. TaxID=3014275 RepID=UPI00404AE973
MAPVLMKGNDAMAEAAVRAGCRFFAGYPITPQSEILEYLARRMPEVGGVFLQSESEIAGISMVYGAAAAGFRALTSSSGPGFSLMQEGISYIASAELPCVIINVMRYGSGLGDIFQAQGDYWQAVKNGGHGDYRCPVYAPASVQEAADMVYQAFTVAEEYRNPVLVLTDASISQMMEPVELPPFATPDPNRFSWSLKGKNGGDFRRITSVMYYRDDYDQYLKQKYHQMAAREQRWEEWQTADAQLVLVAYGISARICREAVNLGRRQGLPLGLFRPRTLCPFPSEGLRKLPRARALLTVELSCLGQMGEDVQLACGMHLPVQNYLAGSRIPDAQDIVDAARQILLNGGGGEDCV